MTKFKAGMVNDPLDIEIEPGRRVRDLKTRQECEQALHLVDMDRERILSQIANSEASLDEPPPGWRTRAGSALRWKKRAHAAIMKHMGTLPKSPTVARRHVLLINMARQEIGDDAFDRLAERARLEHPELFGEDGS